MCSVYGTHGLFRLVSLAVGAMSIMRIHLASPSGGRPVAGQYVQGFPSRLDGGLYTHRSHGDVASFGALRVGAFAIALCTQSLYMTLSGHLLISACSAFASIGRTAIFQRLLVLLFGIPLKVLATIPISF